MSYLNLVIDRQNKKLVSYLGSPTSIPDQFQSNTVSLRLTFVDPADALGNYTLVDMSASGLRVSAGQTPTGTAGGPTVLALQTAFTWNAASKYFSGDLAMNTAGIDSFLAAADSKTAYFEVNETLAGNRNTLLQTTFNLKAVVDELSSNAPSPTDQYLTKAEALAAFVKFLNDAGAVITLKSPDGTRSRELGVNNDGSAIDNTY